MLFGIYCVTCLFPFILLIDRNKQYNSYKETDVYYINQFSSSIIFLEQLFQTIIKILNSKRGKPCMKSVRIRVILVRMRENADRITPNTDIFYAVK